MKVYKIILTIVLVAVIAFGVWYCLATYNERSSEEKGMLVQGQSCQVLGDCGR